MEFSHIDENGNAIMVDVSSKKSTKRTAVAVGEIKMSKICFQAVCEHNIKKGNVLNVAQIAGIMATKQTSHLIPLCHTLCLTNSNVTFEIIAESSSIKAFCSVSCIGNTGVEMEALTGVSIALLTIYDMCKALDKEMIIHSIHLLKKQGGKNGDFRFSTSLEGIK